MRSMDEEMRLVGKRVKVTSKAGTIDLGLGTYLWMGEILLDTGKKIQEEHCTFETTDAHKVPPFEIEFIADTRLFKLGGGLSPIQDFCLEKGDKVRVKQLLVLPWNHGSYVAGQFRGRLEDFYIIMSEVELPEERPPHLRLVAAA